MPRLLIILLCCLSIQGFAQSQQDHYSQLLDSVITRAEEISYYADEVDWKSLREEMHALAPAPSEVQELKPALELMLNTLRDHHGQVRLMSDYSILASFTDHTNSRNTDTRDRDMEIWSVVNDVNARFYYELLPDQIGYLRVVGVGPNVDLQQEAQRIRNTVKQLADQGVKKWILDLRYNGGGNMHVMLAGLAPLLDTEEVVHIKDASGQTQGTASIRNGEVWYYEAKAFDMPFDEPIDDPQIAVLLSRYTVSSGELTAVAFSGQENVQVLGEATGGYTTNNGWDIFGNEIALVISTGVYADRNGQRYDQCVTPDVEVVFEVEEELMKDNGVLEALKWFGE